MEDVKKNLLKVCGVIATAYELWSVIVGVIAHVKQIQLDTAFFLTSQGIMIIVAVVVTWMLYDTRSKLLLYEKLAEERPALLMTIRMILNQKVKNTINQIEFSRADLAVEVPSDTEMDVKKNVYDLVFSWELSGTNTQNKDLSVLYLRMGADNIVGLDRIAFSASQIDLNNGEKKEKIHWDNVKITRKGNFYIIPLVMPMPVPKKHTFKVQISYRWPQCYNSDLDYLIIDPMNFSTQCLKQAKIYVKVDGKIVNDRYNVMLLGIKRKPSTKDSVEVLEEIKYMDNRYESSLVNCKNNYLYFVEIAKTNR